MTYCNAEFHLRGEGNGLKAIFETFLCADNKEITFEGESEGKYVLYFEGDCSDDIEQFRNKEYIAGVVEPNANGKVTLDGEEISLEQYTWASISKMLNCEIEVHSSNPEQGWERFDRYVDGTHPIEELGQWIENQCWFRNECETYEEFCEQNDIDSDLIPESEWIPEDPDDEECEVYIICSERGTIDYHFDF